MAISPRLRQIMFFSRLKAAGNFNPKCALEKGRCKGKYTKISAKALAKTEFANTNKESKNYQKMISLGKKNFNKSGGGASFDRKAAIKALTDAKGKGNKVSIVSKTDASGARKTTARVRGEKDVRKTTTETKSQQLTQQLREERKKDSFKRTAKKERAKKLTEMAKDNKSLTKVAEKAQKEAKPTVKQKQRESAMKTNIIKAKKKESAAKKSNISEEDKQRKRDADFARLTALNNKDKKKQQSKKFVKSEGKNRGIFNAKTMKFEKKV